MEDYVYRTQVRLKKNDRYEAQLLEKIQNRNTALYKTVNDYIIHALYAFEEEGQQMEQFRAVLREELGRFGAAFPRQELPVAEARTESRLQEKTERTGKRQPSGMTTDTLDEDVLAFLQNG